MHVIVLGAGAIGTWLAVRLARAGHDVTLVARGARLEALRRTHGALRARSLLGGTKEESVTVEVAGSLATVPASDLLVVTVRRQHADLALEEVARARADRVMFMFNIAADLSRFRDAVGRDRFYWGFPAAVARLEGEELLHSTVPSALRSLQITTIGGLVDHSPPDLTRLTRLFRDAGIPCAECADMQSWLGTHAAFMAPLMSSSILAERGRGLDWNAARLVAAAMDAGFRAVALSGARVVPWNMALLRRVPTVVKALALWGVFRLRSVREALGGELARDEADAMLQDLDALSGREGSLRRLRLALGRDHDSNGSNGSNASGSA